MRVMGWIFFRFSTKIKFGVIDWLQNQKIFSETSRSSFPKQLSKTKYESQSRLFTWFTKVKRFFLASFETFSFLSFQAFRVSLLLVQMRELVFLFGVIKGSFFLMLTSPWWADKTCDAPPALLKAPRGVLKAVTFPPHLFVHLWSLGKGRGEPFNFPGGGVKLKAFPCFVSPKVPPPSNSVKFFIFFWTDFVDTPSCKWQFKPRDFLGRNMNLSLPEVRFTGIS